MTIKRSKFWWHKGHEKKLCISKYLSNQASSNISEDISYKTEFLKVILKFYTFRRNKKKMCICVCFFFARLWIETTCQPISQAQDRKSDLFENSRKRPFSSLMHNTWVEYPSCIAMSCVLYLCRKQFQFAVSLIKFLLRKMTGINFLNTSDDKRGIPWASVDKIYKKFILVILRIYHWNT